MCRWRFFCYTSLLILGFFVIPQVITSIYSTPPPPPPLSLSRSLSLSLTHPLSRSVSPPSLFLLFFLSTALILSLSFFISFSHFLPPLLPLPCHCERSPYHLFFTYSSPMSMCFSATVLTMLFIFVFQKAYWKDTKECWTNYPERVSKTFRFLG